MNLNLTDADRADLARILRELIEADRYPFSPKVRRLKELLATVDPTQEPVVTPYPARGRQVCLAYCYHGRSSGGGETYRPDP
jgi:hypothetical protein